jgi:hypothetical protein
MNTSTLTNASASAAKPWWSFGMVWMIIAGPAVVVVAAFATLYLAITIPDPVLPTEAVSSAMQARNHAATGVVPQKLDKK